MIRQVSRVVWDNVIASKGSPQAQTTFLQEFDNYREDWKNRKVALTAQYKNDLQNPAYIAAKEALQDEANATLLSYGFYEEISEEELDNRFVNDVYDAVINKPLLILCIITKITNYYRRQQNKSELTELQVKTRLLS